MIRIERVDPPILVPIRARQALRTFNAAIGQAVAIHIEKLRCRELAHIDHRTALIGDVVLHKGEFGRAGAGVPVEMQSSLQISDQHVLIAVIIKIAEGGQIRHIPVGRANTSTKRPANSIREQ